MKKTLLKYFAIVTLLSIVINMPIYTYADDEDIIASEIKARVVDIKEGTFAEIEKIVRKEAPAQKQYEDLLSSLQSPVQTQSSRTATTNTVLFDHYGGAFLNEDKKLTICTTSDQPEIISMFKEAVNTTDLVIKQVENTLEEIYSAKDSYEKQLNDYCKKSFLNQAEQDLIEDIVESYTNVFENQFVVGILELNQEKINLFWKLFDLPTDVICLQSAEKTVEYASIRPGNGLYLSASASTTSTAPNQSVGYRGYRLNYSGNRVYGFTGCGHGATSSLYRSGELVGNIYDSRCGGNYDIAFYDATTNTSLSNTVAYSDDMGNAISGELAVLSTVAAPTSESILLGTTAMKVGSKTFFTQGVIESTDFRRTTSDGTTYTNTIRSKARASNGDSGGAVFIYYGGDFEIIGTVTGGSTSGTYSFAAKYQYAYNALDSVIYRY